MRICICGGGSLGHVIAGKIADKGEQVSILTRQPNKWNKELQVDDCAGNLFRGKLACVTHKAELVIPDADIILLCLEVLIFKRVVNKHMLTYTSIKHKNNPLTLISISFGVVIAFHIV